MFAHNFLRGLFLLFTVLCSLEALCQNKPIYSILKHNESEINQLIVEAKNHLKSNDVDTLKFNYIPVIHGFVCVASAEYTKFDTNLLTEILLFNKRAKKIVGTYYFCKGSSSYFYLKDEVNTIPCREDNRYFRVKENRYSKIEKIIRRGEKGILLSIEGLDYLFFVTSQGTRIIN